VINFSLSHYQQASAEQQANIASIIHQGFLTGDALYITDYEFNGISEDQVRQNLALVRDTLKRLEIDEGFIGIDGKPVKRRSFCVINEFNCPDIQFSYISRQVGVCDGDPESLLKGLAVLQAYPELVCAIEQNNLLINNVIDVVMGILQHNLNIPEHYFSEHILSRSTYRQRLAYYDARVHKSLCGVHPDGNLLSFLITDKRGFRYFDSNFRVHEPAPDGIVCLVGSLLWRWSRGLYPPVFHYVKQMSGESKTSIVYLYNLEDNKAFPAVPYGESEEVYINDIRKYKPEDLSRDGPFADIFEMLIERADYK
jgi:2OG-Fe(II) oxygenase superfamily